MLDLLFIISSLGLIVGSVLVVTESNVMHACLYLLMALFSVAGLYITLNADFLAAIQLVVYAGGVVILMLFAIMLTGGAKEIFNKFGIEKTPGRGNFKSYFSALVTAAILLLVCLRIITKVENANTGEGFYSTVEQIGTLLITDHVLAFEISSVLLLGALIGAAIIARPRSLFKESEE